MLKKRLFIFLIFTIVSLCLLIYSGPCLQGAKNGINLCFSIVIPSLFPFTVCALIISESGFLEKINNKFLNSTNFPIIDAFIFIFSLIGGFPIGAKLINNSYIKCNITKSKADAMLAYCVNSGPAFIIVAIGSGILKDKRLGIVLFSANLLSTVTLFALISFIYKGNQKNKRLLIKDKTFAEIFVNCTYDATKAMGLICAFVILFSTIIEFLNSILKPTYINRVLISFLEITNGVSILDNIYLIAFLLGFSGICVHFQVLSMCSAVKIKYLKFFILHGIINTAYTLIIIKTFKISISAASKNNNYSIMFSERSVIFGIIFMLLSVAFICSVNTKKNIL